MQSTQECIACTTTDVDSYRKTKNSTTNDDELSGEQHESNFQVETSNNSSGDNFEVDKWLDDNEDENLLVNLEDDFENQSVPTVVILDDDIPHDVVIETEFEIDDDIPNDVLNNLDGYECQFDDLVTMEII